MRQAIPAHTSEAWHLKATQDQRYLEFVARLRAARVRRDVSQAELARRLGRPQSYVSKVEMAERRVDLVEAMDLCGALGVTIAEVVPSELRHLLGGDGGD